MLRSIMKGWFLMFNNEINAVFSIFADAARYSSYGSTKHARNEYTPRAKRGDLCRHAPELIGEYDLVKLHVGQFVLDVDAGSLNSDRTEFKPDALAYILDLAQMKKVSLAVRIALEEGYKERFSIRD